jgi:hypothetical protein
LRLPIEGTPWLHIPNASLTALAFEGDRDPHVIALNWLPNPSWLRPAPAPETATGANSAVSTIDTLPERGQE